MKFKVNTIIYVMNKINNNYDLDIVIDSIKYDDYDDYMKIMYEFSNYSINKDEVKSNKFKEYIDWSKNKNVRIYCVKKNNNLIGVGSLFILDKLHNNKVGQIEDVIITKDYRQQGYGKYLIQKLVDVAKKEFECYKVVLNCLEKNVGFYEKCDFKNVGYQMRL